jgi:hypothetical protein
MFSSLVSLSGGTHSKVAEAREGEFSRERAAAGSVILVARALPKAAVLLQWGGLEAVQVSF